MTSGRTRATPTTRTACRSARPPHPPTGATSTSEPHPDQDLEAGDRVNPPEKDKIDD